MITSTVAMIMALGFVAVASASEDEACYEDFWFWKLGHMDGPHVASMALGISRDGETIVGKNLFVGTDHAFRIYVEYVLASNLDGDTIPPLFNELQVQEDLGGISPQKPSAAFAATDMTYVPINYEKYDDETRTRDLDWGGSTVVGTQFIGPNSNAIQWLKGK